MYYITNFSFKDYFLFKISNYKNTVQCAIHYQLLNFVILQGTWHQLDIELHINLWQFDIKLT